MHIVFGIFALLGIANGLWMLLAPMNWYLHLPAGVPDTGPFNHHFVQDIGAAFLTLGAAFAVATARPACRRGVALAGALFMTLHAVVHLVDLLAGRLHARHWTLDLPGVFLPAIVLLVLCLPRWWRSPQGG
jgi:hypothetical protein